MLYPPISDEFATCGDVVSGDAFEDQNGVRTWALICFMI